MQLNALNKELESTRKKGSSNEKKKLKEIEDALQKQMKDEQRKLKVGHDGNASASCFE